MIETMERETLRISETDLVRDVLSIIKCVENGTEVTIERDARAIAVLRAAPLAPRTISESIELAKAHEEESGQALILDADFAADIEAIVRGRRPRRPLPWG